MSYKTIAVHVNESRHSAGRIELAAALAARFDARLVGVAATGLPQSMHTFGSGGEGNAALAAYLDFAKGQALTALAGFESIASRTGATFERHLIEDEAAIALCLQARYSDLLVIGQSDPDEPMVIQRTDLPEYVITHAPRPVLILPYAGRFDAIGERVVIAWDGSMGASHSVASSLPLLKQAQVVQVAVFNAEKYPFVHGEEPGADLGRYLAHHGIHLEVTQQTTDDGMDVGNALLSHLADYGADLLVMGGYGHSRFHEILLGGVTKTMLRSMTVPVLMAH